MLATLGAAGVLAWYRCSASATQNPTPIAAPGKPMPSAPDGLPWRRGSLDARFRVVVYADLECPHCATYVPSLVRWIDEHPVASLQWHHAPSAVHDPAATELGSLAECAGVAGGAQAIFAAVDWIYAHTRGNGQGLPPQTAYPHASKAMDTCLASGRGESIVRDQADQARRQGIIGTPSVLVLDLRSGESLRMAGPVHGDALLFAFDWLATAESAREKSEMPPREPAEHTPM